jgi:hypothetical protein
MVTRSCDFIFMVTLDWYRLNARELRNCWGSLPFHRSLYRAAAATALIVWGITMVGCRPTEPKISDSDVDLVQDVPKVSAVPLRVWVASPVERPDILVRQWRSSSEQPIEVTALSEDELLQRSDLPADVLLAPTRLLGELLHRNWIAKLPERLLKSPSSAVEDNPGVIDQGDFLVNRSPPGLITATSYAGIQYGVPLGHSMIQLVGSSQVSDVEMSWEQLANRLDRNEIDLLPLAVEDNFIDASALVDRFLAIAMGVSPVNAKYGVLFEIRSLKARLTAEEFMFSARLLQKMAHQHNAAGWVTVLGAHSDAWEWIQQTDQTAYALISISGLDAKSRSMEAAKSIALEQTRHWNDGAGLMATLPVQCRQTVGATRFIQWISGDRRLADLQDSIPGLLPLRNTGILLADRLAQKNLQILQDQNLICELRTPHAAEYRSALAGQLISMLRGDQTAQQALEKAAVQWDAITGLHRKTMQAEYEKSLGLTL